MFLFIFPLAVVLLPARALAVSRFAWPLDGRLTRGFEKARGPYGEGGHQGLDIEAPPGSPVKSAADGTVRWTGELPRGRCISIGHEGGEVTTCLGLDRLDVHSGERVRLGQVIGTLAGGSDDSSPSNHLHFGASVGGTPLDPRVLMSGGIDGGSFIRLCPVERPGGTAASTASRTPSRSFWSWAWGGMKAVSSPFTGAWDGVKAGAQGTWGGVKAGAQGTWNGVKAGAQGIWKATCWVGRGVSLAAKWVWSNRWVRAIVAGLAAAVCIVVGVVIVVLVLSVSLVVGFVAAVAGAVAAVVACIVYATCHPDDFSFFGCFMTSLSTGFIASGIAGGLTSLFTAASVGWTELGIWGVSKSALGSGLFSSAFDLSSSYLLTGHISWKSALAAFAIGAASGAFGRVVLKGMSGSSKIAEIFARANERVGSFRMLGALICEAREGAAGLRALLSIGKDFSIRFGTKFAYSFTSGVMGTTGNAVYCLMAGKPVTLSGSLAAFFAGAIAGSLAMTFGFRGIRGALNKLITYDGKMARSLKYMLSKMLNKAIHKGLNAGFKKLFTRWTKEEAR